MAPAIASAASAEHRPLLTSGCGAGPGAQCRGGLRRAQSAPVLCPGPAVPSQSGCPALAWADMLELDALLPDDSLRSSSGDGLSVRSSSDDGLSAILAGLDAGGPSPTRSHQHSPAAAGTPLGLPFEAPFDTLPLKMPAASDRAVHGTRTPLSTKAAPFFAAGASVAGTLLQRSSGTWAFGRDGERLLNAHQTNDACSAPETRTTVMMRNVPYMWTREKLLALLDSKGFAAKYDFVGWRPSRSTLRLLIPAATLLLT
ncbi:unnamed protein product [Prorocentrum cordatum]|uniref:RRM domain-containing protein n=1 Tax=Prorocentrum cordatum TaxID=2364126 RepID=A0ABN9Q5D5_9DINO|nr:unnamed protein product [Polarella glacialis]